MNKILRIIFCLGVLCILSACRNTVCVEHDLYEIVEQEATCFNVGIVTTKCKNCEYSVQKEIDRLEHSIVINEEVLPSCEKAGLTEGSYCAVCNEIIVRQEVIPPTNHNYVSATCEKPQHCINCNKEIGDKLEHQFIDGECIYCDEEEISNVFLFKLSEDGSYYIIEKLKDQTITHLVIPEKYKNLPIKIISKHSIKDAPKVKDIIIPNTIEIIEDEAFINLSSVETIFLSSGSLKIGYSAFTQFANLKEVYFNGTIDEWLSINFVDKTSNPMYHAEKFYLNNKLITEVIIPEKIEKLRYQLYNFKQLKKLIIPNTVNLIEKGALDGCKNLEYLELPFLGKTLDAEKEQHIRYIFNLDEYESWDVQNKIYKEYALKEVVLTEAIQISEGAFKYLANIEKVTFSNNIKIIPKETFYNSQVKEVILPNNLEKINDYAFCFCRNLNQIEFPDTLIEIGKNAFQGVSLENVVLPQQLQKIGNYGFSGTTINEIVIPESVTTIGSYAFGGCLNLKKVILSNNIDTIKEGTFAECMSLEKIDLPSSLTKIEREAFSYNCNLTSLYLPSSIKIIQDGVFDNSNQIVLYLEHSEIPDTFSKDWNYSSFEYGNLTTSRIKYYLNVNEENYTKDENFEYIIFDNYAICTKLINKELEEVSVPSTINKNNIEYDVLKIGDFCFYNGMSNYQFLRGITIPTTIKEIGDYAFYNSNIEKFILSKYLDKMGKYCFANCTQLTEVSVEKFGFLGNISTLEEGTFFQTNLETLMLPNTITSFEKCSIEIETSILTNFKLPNNLSWSNNSGLELFINSQVLNEYNNGLYLGSNSNPYHTLIKLIDENVETFTLHKDTKIIAKHAIYNCENLQAVYLPEGLLCIDTESFWNLNNLNEIIIPDTVKYINEIAFEMCKKLTIKTTNISKPETWHEIFYGVSKVVYNLKDDTSTDNKEEVTPVILTLTKEVAYDATPATLDLPSTVTFDYNNETVTENVTWDTTLFVVNKIGKQKIYGTVLNDLYEVNKICIEIDVFPYTFLLDETINEYSIIKCYGSGTDIIIPNTFNDVKITSIANYAFRDCRNLTNVYYDGTIESWCNINFGTSNSNPMAYASHFYMKNEEGAWYELTEIIIPNTIIKKGNYQFFGFENITSITISNNVASIGHYSFSKCSRLTSIMISEGVTSIGSNVFDNCNSLTNVYYDGTIKSWCNIIFYSNTSNPMDYANYFYMKNEEGNWYEVTEVIIPNTITQIGKYQFNGFENLTSVIISSDVTSIDDYSFNKCISLTSIEIPEGVTSIGGFAFSKCSYLTNIVIPEGVTSIGNSAFSNCISLTNITIPSSVISIENNTFFKCNSLIGVTIKEGVTSIGDSVFSDCTSLTSINIPNSVTSIGDSVFSDCTSLTNINISNSVTSIEYQAFYNCSNLINIVLPEGLTSIGSSAFYNCSSLISIEIPKELKRIETNAFTKCSSLTNVYYEGTIESWCNINLWTNTSNPMYFADHFYMKNEEDNWYEVTEIEVPNTIIKIKKYQFYGFKNVTSIIIPSGVTTIGDYAFENCSNLTIYCEAESQPEGWSSSWNSSSCIVYFGYKKTEK